MRIYQRKEQNVGKWVLAGLAFLFVMTLTFAEVNGVNVPSKPGGDNSSSTGTTHSVTDNGGQGNGNVDPTPSAVPEPSTMILMGLGLGAAALWRSRKKEA